MKAETSKNREWSQELLDRAVEFHGHRGPLMVVGLRMGLLALRILEAKGWYDLRCRIFTRRIHPDSCVIDGIQISTGCTMGKHNIELEEREGVSAEFATACRRLKIHIKPKLLDRIHKTISLEDEEATNALVDELIEKPYRYIFEIN